MSQIKGPTTKFFILKTYNINIQEAVIQCCKQFDEMVFGMISLGFEVSRINDILLKWFKVSLHRVDSKVDIAILYQSCHYSASLVFQQQRNPQTIQHTLQCIQPNFQSPLPSC